MFYLKVIVLSGYGNDILPSEFVVDYSNPLWRFDKDLINQIECKDWVLAEDYIDTLEEDTLYCQRSSDGMEYIYPISNSISNFIIFSIVEVDNTRPWCIEEYDGSEYIKYLDNYSCISKDFNFYKLKG